MKEKRGKTPHIVAQNGGHLFIDYNFITDFERFVTKTAEKVYFHFLSPPENPVHCEDLGIFTVAISEKMVYNVFTVVKSVQKWYAVPKIQTVFTKIPDMQKGGGRLAAG